VGRAQQNSPEISSVSEARGSGKNEAGYDRVSSGPGVGGRLVSFLLNTLLAYLCAVRLSPWLVYHWFGWVVPVFMSESSIPPTDWYLQHLEWATILPAAIVGCGNLIRYLPVTIRDFVGVRGFDFTGVWAWVVPSLVLGYHMSLYSVPSSVLYHDSSSVIRYFFDIQHVMPTRQNFLSIDSLRVLTQMTVTAPFYAGVAYSLGAWISEKTRACKVVGWRKLDG
jgi:hypothetical protein